MSQRIDGWDLKCLRALCAAQDITEGVSGACTACLKFWIQRWKGNESL